MHTVYAEKTPVSVQIYRDAAKTVPFCRFTRGHGKVPDRRNRYVTLNCYKWQLVWL